MRLSKERREQIGAYGQKWATENGLILINRLVDIFNEQEDKPATLEEMLHGLRRFIAMTPKSEVSFAIYNDAYIVDIKFDKSKIEEMISNDEADCCQNGCEHHHEAATISEIEETIATLQTENLNQQAELIGLIAEISAPLYGVLNFQELTDILNHYHPKLNIVKDDILPALTKHIESFDEDVDYTIFEGFVVSPMILPNAIDITDADVELIDHIRTQQKAHKRYLPTYEEFAFYATPTHEMMTDSFDSFLNFLDKNSKRLGIKKSEIGNLAVTFLQLLKAGMETKYFIEFFQEEGCHFSSTQFINEFMIYTIEVYNNTRMYDLNGHTLKELKLEVNMPSEEHATPKAMSKVGRNEPCPCGSGEKYKKCCL